MDWKTKLVLPPNYVTLQHLKELRMKEKSELELKAREEAEAEYKSRVEEDEQRVKKLKEEEEEKRRIDEEKKMKEEEEKKMREKEEEEEEEEERLKRESIRREQINKTRKVLCGEPSRRTKKKNFRKYSDDVKEIIDKKEEIVTQGMIKDENLKEEGKKKTSRKRGRKRGKGKEKKEALELESQRVVDETLKSETKSSEEEEVIPDTKPKGNIYKNTRQRKSVIVVDKILMNQKVEEIEKKIGDLNVNVDDDKKMKSRAEKQFLTTQVKIDNKQHQFRIQNIQKHGIYVHNPRNASCSSLVWMPKDI